VTDLLAIYDEQLRLSEVRGAMSYDADGPLLRAVFDDGGAVTYRDLAGLTGAALTDLITRTVAHFRDETELSEFEWKTRGHDAPPDLGQRLVAAGFVPEEEETVMMGEAALLVDAPPVDGVAVRRIDPGPDRDRLIAGVVALRRALWGEGPSAAVVAERLDRDPQHHQYWVAETATGEVVCAGRLELVPGTEVAGLWGGETHPDWRGRGIYRSLTAARARATLDAGWRYLHSDCSPMSRPILERSGLQRVTTTTPYIWRR
jgi:hypothetical protein